MTEYLHIYTDRGRLSYIPEYRYRPSSRICRGFFQARHRRPHLVRVSAVAPEPSIFGRQTTNKSYLVEKLAGPRENAKRFLRSIIDSRITHSSQHRDERIPPRPSLSTTSSSEASSSEDTRVSLPANMSHNPRNSVAVGGPRPALVDHRSSGRQAAKSLVNSVVRPIAEERPLAAGNGITVGIQLTEPVLFLQGFEQSENLERSTAMLRGTLQLRVTKPSKIKAINLKFRGRATTKWPEGMSTHWHPEATLICQRHPTKEGRL
jgi:hypothetical protein